MRGFDLVSAEARARIEAWGDKSRHLFTELLEDAPSDMQRELLNRVVAAGHTPAEVHAFADSLRGMTDDEAFDACTIDRGSAPGYSVMQLLKAEADPLFAYRLKGGELSPAEPAAPTASDATTQPMPPAPPAKPKGRLDDTDPKIRREAQRAFDARDDGALRRTAQARARELGSSPDAPASRPPSGGTASVPPAGSGPVLAQDLLNEGLHALGVTFREQPVDGPGQLKLEDAMSQAAAALSRGTPVAVTLGPAPGQDRRVALFLQMQQSGKSRAFQLYDVMSQEVAWINEGDLLARTELPFASKANKRITRIVLPSMRSF